MLLPSIGDPSVVGVLWMYPSLLHRTFGVLYVEHAICLPSLSLLYCLALFLLICELAFVVIVEDVGIDDCQDDCQNDSIVGWFDGSGVTLHFRWSSSDCACPVCSIGFIAATRSVHSSETAFASVVDNPFSAFLKNTSVNHLSCCTYFQTLV